MGSVSGSGSYTGEDGTVYFEGDLSPGNSPASVSFESDLVLGSTMRLVMEIGGPTPGLQYDVVGFGGKTVLDGTLEVALLGGFMPQAGQEFDILNFDPASVTGHFDAVELPVLIKGLSWDTSGLYTQGAITVAPEPATLALMGLGLALGLGRKRRR
jgi:hypothetical protein